MLSCTKTVSWFGTKQNNEGGNTKEQHNGNDASKNRNQNFGNGSTSLLKHEQTNSKRDQPGPDDDVLGWNPVSLFQIQVGDGVNNSQVTLSTSQEVKIHLHTECRKVKTHSDHVPKSGVKTAYGKDPAKDAQHLSGHLVVSDEVSRPVCPDRGSLSPLLQSNKADEETERQEDDAVGGSVEGEQDDRRGRVHAVQNEFIHAES